MQQTLFTSPRTLAHRNDPETSLEAAKDLYNTGTLGRMDLCALNLVMQWPGKTAAELERQHGYEKGQLATRISTLLTTGKLVRGDKRKCDISGRSAFTIHTPTSLRRQKNEKHSV